MTRAEAAAEVGTLCNRILALAPVAGLHVGIKITPAQVDTRRMAETGTGSVRSTGSAVHEVDAPNA